MIIVSILIIVIFRQMTIFLLLAKLYGLFYLFIIIFFRKYVLSLKGNFLGWIFSIKMNIFFRSLQKIELWILVVTLLQINLQTN